MLARFFDEVMPVSVFTVIRAVGVSDGSGSNDDELTAALGTFHGFFPLF